MSLARKKLGRAGEDFARKYLQRRGYRVLARNYAQAGGEIDLICLHEGTIVFVEVKTRSDAVDSDNDPFVAAGQWRHATNAARAWLAAHREPDCCYRFDAVNVTLPPEGEPSVRHIVNAYMPTH